jgi:hypothetical protein
MMNTEPGRPALLTVSATSLAPDELRRMDAYWRAANYLSVGQIYLYDNPLLREPLAPEHIRVTLLVFSISGKGSTVTTAEEGNPAGATSTPGLEFPCVAPSDRLTSGRL